MALKTSDKFPKGSWQILEIYFQNRQDEKKEEIFAEAFRIAHYNIRPIIPSREVYTVYIFLLPMMLTDCGGRYFLKGFMKGSISKPPPEKSTTYPYSLCKQQNN
ncbi:hypothetical protein Anas_13966 [Armadillidium nasatum]|uniref:Uncharacterized protein n=1 Tax=Armadillidium nasatum TaxID=96803 RepID=A0A5N5T2P4_9CRUS|nr:hypothetical protein Anas_13966 [Armadillidium nasatum]